MKAKRGILPHYYYIILTTRKVLRLSEYFIIACVLIPIICSGSNDAIYSWTFWAENLPKVPLSWFLNSWAPAYQSTEPLSFVGCHGWEGWKWLFGSNRSSGHWCGAQNFHNTREELAFFSSPHASVKLWPAISHGWWNCYFKFNTSVLHRYLGSKSLHSTEFLPFWQLLESSDL